MIVYYKSIKITINISDLIEIIIDIIVRHYNLLNLIIISQKMFFTLKF